MFAWTKVLNEGTSNPIVARISIGLSEIVRSTNLTEKEKQEITNLLYALTNEMITAKKRATVVINELKGIEDRIAKKEKLVSIAELDSFESALDLDYSRDFLGYSKSAFAKTAKIMGIVFSQGWSNGSFHTIEKYLKAKLESDACLLKLLEEYKPWYTEVIELRNKDEHQEYHKDFLVNYKIKKAKEFYYLERPKFTGNIPVYDFLEASMKYILPFCEGLILFSLLERLPPIYTIVMIDERNIDPQCSKRFRVSLAGQEDMLWQAAFTKLTATFKAVVRSKGIVG